MRLPKVILTDIDGVWTDGGMYYDQGNNELKKFNTSDSWGVAMCNAFGIEVIVVTGENTEIVRRRCEKLKIETFFMGVSDKLSKIDGYLKSKNISWEEVAYIGDDINDIKLMKMVGIKGTPQNGIEYIKKMADIITEKRGGEGAFREFVEKILLNNFSYNQILEKLGAI